MHNVQFSRLLLENSVQERCYVPLTNFSVLSPLSLLLFLLYFFLHFLLDFYIGCHHIIHSFLKTQISIKKSSIPLVPFLFCHHRTRPSNCHMVRMCQRTTTLCLMARAVHQPWTSPFAPISNPSSRAADRAFLEPVLTFLTPFQPSYFPFTTT